MRLLVCLSGPAEGRGANLKWVSCQNYYSRQNFDNLSYALCNDYVTHCVHIDCVSLGTDVNHVICPSMASYEVVFLLDLQIACGLFDVNY